MSELPARAGDHTRAADAARVSDMPGGPGGPDGPDGPDAPRRTARDFRLAGPGGVDIVPASQIELPDFHLDRRTHTDTPRESLRRFEPERAGLPETTLEEAPGYIRDNVAQHPWLRSAEHAPPEVQRPFAALDRGRGHAGERHEGEVTSMDLQARVTRLEDPAQLDPVKRERSQDAFKQGVHGCGAEATQIWHPDAFATAFARGIEHPRVRAALEQPYVPQAPAPVGVEVPIERLLGPQGHEFCAGYRLQPVDGSVALAREQRREWVAARREGVEPSVPEPRCEPIESFEGGKMLFFFRPNAAKDGYEVSTMYPAPKVDGTGEGNA